MTEEQVRERLTRLFALHSEPDEFHLIQTWIEQNDDDEGTLLRRLMEIVSTGEYPRISRPTMYMRLKHYLFWEDTHIRPSGSITITKADILKYALYAGRTDIVYNLNGWIADNRQYLQDVIDDAIMTAFVEAIEQTDKS